MKELFTRSGKCCPITLLILVVLLGNPPTIAGAEETSSTNNFTENVLPILRKNCFRCHGEKNQEAGLRLDVSSAVFASADSGEPIVVPENPAASLLVQRVAGDSHGEQMPPDAPPLSNADLETLRRWIQQGADWPDDDAATEHWAYQPITKPVPRTATTTSNTFPQASPIDAFIQHRLRNRSLQPAPRATPERLLRRASLVLTGLPPTIAQLDAFLADPSPLAYERAIDRMLASAQFGQRWSTPWLDLARYADSNGFQADQIRDNWAYRDWLIQALNSDMPFDQFTIEQLAGDLLPNATLEQKIATGFHRMTTCNVEAGVHPEANRVNQVVDRVNTTATVFLGTTLECAQCHDHKYDPFSQEDYYKFFAYFNNTPLEVKQTEGVTWDFYGPTIDLPLSESQLQKRKLLITESKNLQLMLDANAVEFKNHVGKWFDDLQALKSTSINWQPTVPESLYPQRRRKQKELRELTKRLADINPETTLVMEDLPKPRETFVMLRGEYEQLGKKVQPATPSALPRFKHEQLDKQLDSGTRLELARWLVSADNPLVARVTVNRWWSQIFGAGLVTTPEDFGTQSEPPSHPQLLDWLASELIESGWSMKHVIREIVLSDTFCQKSHCTPDAIEKDPANRWLARGPRYRLTAETIRDNALAVSGMLSTKMYGPPVMPHQPANLWRSVGRNQPKWIAAENEDRFRRGLYVVFKRASPYPSFINFDTPDRGSCTVQRATTNTPLQALTLMNDPAYAELALAFADRLLAIPAESDKQRLQLAMKIVVSRVAEPKELEVLQDLLDAERQLLAKEPDLISQRTSSKTDAVRLAAADKAELAAWFTIASVLLNLDETINL